MGGSTPSHWDFFLGFLKHINRVGSEVQQPGFHLMPMRTESIAASNLTCVPQAGLYIAMFLAHRHTHKIKLNKSDVLSYLTLNV